MKTYTQEQFDAILARAELAEAKAKAKAGKVEAVYDFYLDKKGRRQGALKFTNSGTRWQGESMDAWKALEDADHRATQRRVELARVNERWDSVDALMTSDLYRDAVANIAELMDAGLKRFKAKNAKNAKADAKADDADEADEADEADDAAIRADIAAERAKFKAK